MKQFFCILIVWCLSFLTLQAQSTVVLLFQFPPALTAYAGNDTLIKLGTVAILGAKPVAKGGIAPYLYSWTGTTNEFTSIIEHPEVFTPSKTTYTVIVTDSRNCTATDGVDVRVTEGEIIIDVKETNAYSGISLYPNPTSSVLSFKSTATANNTISIRIISLDGSLVKSYPKTNFNGSAQIDVSDVLKGMYVVEITDNYRTTTQKVYIR
jgi:hypothetical protein